MRSVDQSTDVWTNCYNEQWQGFIVPEAFSHPAKMSYSLVARIYDHAFKSGWLKPGDTVVDPFGGIAGTALHAAVQGVKWIGRELEEKFCVLANQNINLWQENYGRYPEWVRPEIHCGDSRYLCNYFAKSDTGTSVVVSSPPYSESLHTNESTEKDCSRLQEKGLLETRKRLGENSQLGNQGYSDSPGQLGSMREGDISAVLSSPPYAGCPIDSDNQRRCGDKDYAIKPGWDNVNYGKTVGQLGSLPEGDVSAVVSSPPFESQIAQQDRAFTMPHDSTGRINAGYGDNPGNIGNDSGETFWSAAKQIVEQCHSILKPSGVAIWVCKDFVRKGKRVPFSDQWLALCEACGFELICRHQATLVKRGESQSLLEGGSVRKDKERKSFFRRLAERKGSPRIDHEDVICVRKPE